MTAVNRARVAVLVAQAVQRSLVGAHVAAGWRDDDGSGAEHDVAGEQRAFVLENEHEMIGRVPRPVQHCQRGVRELEALVVGKLAVVRKPRRRMRVDRRAGCGGERGGAGIVIGMPVRDRGSPRTSRRRDALRSETRRAGGRRPDRDRLRRASAGRRARHVTVGAVERQGRRVVGAQPRDARAAAVTMRFRAPDQDELRPRLHFGRDGHDRLVTANASKLADRRGTARSARGA